MAAEAAGLIREKATVGEQTIFPPQVDAKRRGSGAGKGGSAFFSTGPDAVPSLMA
jgi:hypothetical protein